MNVQELNVQDLTILLVEPSSTQRKIIEQNLKEAGVEKIDVVSRGEEALAFLEKFPPDLVISSMYLEDMTGTQLVTTMRESEQLQSIPFMLISSEHRFGRLDPIRQAGVVAILPKPFAAAELKRALKNTIAQLSSSELQLDNYDVTTLKVLVVDDSTLARKHICRTLNNMGIEEIQTADDGSSAIPLLNEQQFDLIVTDYNMPEMDGRELVEYIRNSAALSHIPVMMVTSEKNSARLSNVEQVGVSAICDKPFEPDSVRQLLARILS